MPFRPWDPPPGLPGLQNGGRRAPLSAEGLPLHARRVVLGGARWSQELWISILCALLLNALQHLPFLAGQGLADVRLVLFVL